MSLIASIDCGTTSTRFIVFNEKADVLAVEQQEFKQIYEKPGWHAQDPDAMVSSCLSCIDKAVTKLEESGKGKASDIAAIGITNQRETTVVWSRKTGKALCDAIAWPDTRTTHTVRQLAGKSDKGADALKHITGLPLSTYFAGVKLRWLLDNNEAVRKAHDEGDLMFGTVDTWLLYRFTGGVDGGLFLTDCVNASRTMLMDIRKLEWSDECLEYFGFDKRILATIVSNSEVYGELAADCKLKGVKIAGLIGDQQGAMTGQKCFRKGETKNTYGTGCFMLFNTGEEVVPSSHGLLTTVAYKAGKDAKPIYALEGSIAVAGSAIQWVRDKLELIKSAPEIGELASQVEDTGGVYFVTGFSGLFAPYWDDTATGCMIGISAFTNKCHIARATIESVCFQTKAILDAMGADSGAELTALRVDGGMTNSDVAMQIQADIIGLTVDRPKMRESTALGSAIMAGHAIGFHGWDVAKPESLDAVNTAGLDEFKPTNSEQDRAKRYAGWNRAVLRSKAWKETE